MTEQTPEDDIDWAYVAMSVSLYRTLKDQQAVLAKRVLEIRDELSEFVESAGYTDDKGHQRVPLPEEVSGVRALVRQRKAPRVFDPEKAEEILQAIVCEDGGTLWDNCTEMVAVLDEDKVMAAQYEGLLTEEQIDEMYPISESWSFVLDRPK